MKFKSVIILFIITIFGLGLFFVLFLCSESDQEKYYKNHESTINNYAQVIFDDHRYNNISYNNVDEWIITFDSILFLSSDYEGDVHWYYKIEVTSVEISTGFTFHKTVIYYFYVIDEESSIPTKNILWDGVYNNNLPLYYIGALNKPICLYQFSASDIEKLD